ncbi:MAG: M6 family metalloprotease domain-containing protein, partial [Dysgonamonadaceae bacterium]|nr:M6 family metalloprotease domain-containing protein [Dysgonamonadaceae bacterium]
MAFSQKINASPANPDPVKMKQPDGKEVTVILKGDENIKWMESLDGYSLMYGKDNYVVYAVSNEKGDMVPSEVVFGETGLKSTVSPAFLISVKKGLRYSQSQIETFREINDVLKSSSVVPNLRATTGEAKAICALIGFPDKPFAHTVDEFSQLMNQIGYSANGAKGSVRDFYRENSYGKLELIVTVVGPYTVSKESKYYGENNGIQHDKNPGELAREAANFVFTDPIVDPSDYDNDNDGFIDTFHFLYAGYGEEAGGGSDCIWAHKSGFSSALTFGTKKLNVYSCSPELRGNSGNNVTNIGVICHELCHVFGAPDYYDTDNEVGGEFVGTGTWDLMAQGSWNNGGISPAHINMYQKIVFGWVTPVVLTEERNISGMLNSVENPVAYTVQTTTPGEYFILENRQKVKFDEYVRGHGLLIYRVSSQASGNKVDNRTHPQQVYPVCASSYISMPDSDPSSYGNIDSPG